MTTPETPAPSPETIALAAEIERKRAVRKAKLQGVAPTGKPIVAMLDGVAYPLGTPLWRAHSWQPFLIAPAGFIAGVCATNPTKVRVGKDATARAHYANAAETYKAAIGEHHVWPTWELARAELSRIVEAHLVSQRRSLAQTEQRLAEIVARVDPTSP